MTILYVLIPLALLSGASFVIAFLWAARSGQMDDLETPALRILCDDDGPPVRSPSHDSTPGPPPR
ncbi:MAG TPA: cbb3-type cytochrome oxidase assembly protein CcoS [Polyangiaceae bacterium]|nr:cbb3-type cytochrome oxidase assembly protein CcoS [Polyangiaceae bacterium]